MVVDPAMNDLTEQVIGAAIEVHRHLGSGFREATYHKALGIELSLRGIPYACEEPVSLVYKGESIGEGRMDLLVDRRLIVELKTVQALADAHITQVLAYLKATQLSLALLINFHAPVLKEGIRRVAN